MDTPEIPTLPRPKKPLSAYLMYVQEMRSIVKQQQPDAKLIDIAKQIATMWENLSDDEKQVGNLRGNLRLL